jgi:transcriptional regulator with XRE-family HTH domain
MAEDKLTTARKKDYAKTLFLHENLTQEEIADRSGVSRKTISRWINAEDWKGQKVSITITREEQVKNIYNQLRELNDSISQRTEKRYASPPEADTIMKLTAAIQKLEADVGISDIVNVAKGLLEFVRKADTAKAKELSFWLDEYVKEKLRR